MTKRQLIYIGATYKEDTFVDVEELGSVLVHTTEASKNYSNLRRFIRGYVRDGCNVSMLVDSEVKAKYYAEGESESDLEDMEIQVGETEDFHRFIEYIYEDLEFNLENDMENDPKEIYIIDDIKQMMDKAWHEIGEDYLSKIEKILSEGHETGIILIGITSEPLISREGSTIIYKENGNVELNRR